MRLPGPTVSASGEGGSLAQQKAARTGRYLFDPSVTIPKSITGLGRHARLSTSQVHGRCTRGPVPADREWATSTQGVAAGLQPRFTKLFRQNESSAHRMAARG